MPRPSEARRTYFQARLGGAVGVVDGDEQRRDDGRDLDGHPQQRQPVDQGRGGHRPAEEVQPGVEASPVAPSRLALSAEVQVAAGEDGRGSRRGTSSPPGRPPRGHRLAAGCPRVTGCGRRPSGRAPAASPNVTHPADHGEQPGGPATGTNQLTTADGERARSTMATRMAAIATPSADRARRWRGSGSDRGGPA